MTNGVERELQAATDRILQSDNRKKLIVAGPGTGKTFIFRELLQQCAGQPDQRLVLTFINNLKDDLERSLGHLAHVATLHGYCQRSLYQHAELRGGLTGDFICYPGLVSLIKQDWGWFRASNPPEFVKVMRDLTCSAEHAAFYFDRSDYYDAVDFDDSVYRAYRGLSDNIELVPRYELVLIDEFQDFNALEAGVISLLGSRHPIVIAGDDDQALYKQLRSASWDYIRAHHAGNEYEVFELPFCMRCTEVVVAAVNDVIARARNDAKLYGRIPKPYRYYEPQKGEDSQRYPTIDLVCTTVQRANANYFGRYIEQAIRAIPQADIVEANENYEPVALVIGQRPYPPQISQHLIDVGLFVADDEPTQTEREKALKILHDSPFSNLGWRIILSCGDPEIAAERIRAAAKQEVRLFDIIPADESGAVIQEAEDFVNEQAEEEEPAAAPADALNIKLTSFEGSKGLSAQHVFLVGMHDGDLPRNAGQIQDIEICKFVVGLTRTKKKCSLLLTNNFAGIFKTPSPFLGWIDQQRYARVEVNAAYWQQLR